VATTSRYKKPTNLTYGLDDKPPLWMTVIVSLQHIVIMSVGGLIFPVVIMRAMGGTQDQAHTFLSVSMIAGGTATILQALRTKWIGSGYLCPEGPDPSFLSVSLLAVKIGGLPLLYGMTMIAGFFEMLLAPLMYRLRVLFPSEVTGVVVAMVGISVIPTAVSNFFALDSPTAGASSGIAVSIGFIALAVMIGVNIWGKGKVRQTSLLIGTFVGYALAYAFGILDSTHLRQVAEAHLISVPNMSHLRWSFDIALLLPFLVAILGSMLKNIGDITMAQRINDANWKRPDMKSIRGGIMADGFASMLGGALGGMGQASYSSNVGLSVATGATSRIIAFFTGGIFILMAFLPKLSAVLAIMPRPVIGAILLFAVPFMILAGMQIIMSRMIDARKTFVIGVSMILGISVGMYPRLFENVPFLLRPALSYPLSLATMSVIVLNVILRIGTSKKAHISVDADVNAVELMSDFMEAQGGKWGAPRELVQRVTSTLNEFIESAVAFDLATGRIEIEVTYDEFNLNVNILYPGKPMEFPVLRPTNEDLLRDDAAMSRMAGFLMRKYANRMKSGCEEDLCSIQLHFDN
jgi:xanthine permease XanP